MCDFELDLYERFFRAFRALEGHENFLFCREEILFSFCNIRLTILNTQIRFITVLNKAVSCVYVCMPISETWSLVVV